MAKAFGALAALCLGAAQVAADVHPPRPVEPGEGHGLRVVGEIEVVYDYSRERCDKGHAADLPVRAFRDAGDTAHLIVGHNQTRRMSGPSLNDLSVSCDVIMGSVEDPDPANFAYQEWIGGLYTEDGTTVHALLHNEFHGHRSRLASCRSGEYFRCWYNAVTYARSDDSGASFGKPVAIPDHLVAAIPHKYMPDRGIFGAFSPSNILRHEGYYYAFIKVQNPPDGAQHVCLMRTQDLGDPASWRFRSVFGFDGEFIDPYREPDASVLLASCDPIAFDNIAQMYEGVTWNDALQKFVLVGTSNDPARDANVYGFYYALSDDLVNWERRRPLLEVRLPWRVENPNIPVYVYPTLIDPQSPSRNFETTGASMYLYFSRLNNGQAGLDRDLVRMRVEVVR